MKRNKICVVMPTRARPVHQLRALASILATSCGFTDVIVAVDQDDPLKLTVSGPRVFTYVVEKRKPMLHVLDEVVKVNLPYYDIFGFTGDDVVYESVNWDAKVVNALRHTVGVAYGDDSIQRGNLPTHPWFSADFVRVLGYVCAPAQKHYFFDNFLKSLFKPLGSLFHLPEISTRHLHHSVTREMPYDKTYRQAEAGYEEDRTAYTSYLESQLETDIKKLRDYMEASALLPAHL